MDVEAHRGFLAALRGQERNQILARQGLQQDKRMRDLVARV
jgi:hypothetical protein